MQFLEKWGWIHFIHRIVREWTYFYMQGKHFQTFAHFSEIAPPKVEPIFFGIF